MAPTGYRLVDLNQDGAIDALVYFWGRSPLLFANNGTSFIPQPIVSTEDGGSERWYTNTAVTADFNGDGHLDLFFGNYFPDNARVLDATAGGSESMNDSMSRACNGGRNRILLWRTSTDGFRVTFEEAKDIFSRE